MSDYDPYADAERRGFILSRVDLPGDYCAVTDLKGNIWLDNRLLQREERSALAHEIAHYDVPSGAFQGASLEAEVNRIAAERLIDFDELVSAAKWADSIEEMAEELHVNDDLVRARISGLTGAEAKSFQYQAGRVHYSMGQRKPLRRRKRLGGREPLPW